MRSSFILIAFISFSITSCVHQKDKKTITAKKVYKDVPFLQDYSVKYYLQDEKSILKKVFSDRNGAIRVLSSQGLLKPSGGQFLHPGVLVPDLAYRASADKKITDLDVYQNQFVYADDQAVFSNAWAGKLFSKHKLLGAHILLAGGEDFSFLLSDGQSLHFLKDSQTLWTTEEVEGVVADLKYDSSRAAFWVLSANGLYTFSPGNLEFKEVFAGADFQCFDLAEKGAKIAIGTSDGYMEIDAESKKQIGEIKKKLPATNITAIAEIDEKLWFGSNQGAFMLREDGQFNYYSGERWLPDDHVKHISKGEDRSILILTENGLGAVHFKETSLHEKALFYEKQVRSRHIRFGFNATLSGMNKGDIASGYLSDSDNDGLWTAMYLGGQAFRYAVTKSDEALQNCRESLDAMERLYTVNPVPGFPSRSFERSGYMEQLADPRRWRPAEDPEWDWKATTSSDEAIGHIFAFGIVAELIEEEGLKNQAIRLIDTLMQHVVDNDFYLIDYDGQPTTWGRWNPEYVNARLEMVGDRKLNSSNIVAMLQTAYHFTQKEIYKEKAFELMDEHGYLENLLRPIKEIGLAPDEASDWDKMLSENWNHSDDEMYFLGYWGLYRYAFNDTLREKYKAAILDHWQAERPEKEGAWNIFAAMTGAENFDLEEAISYLQEYPLDLINWTVQNSHRKDIEKLEPNFREQFIKEVLPPDELRIARHNANRFTLDGGNGGRSEYSAGDIWLLPYWMGRYLGVIQ